MSCIVEHSRASLYPTQPVAKTVFEAGVVQTVKWKDSDGKPSLKDTPRLRMDLYVDNEVSGMFGYAQSAATPVIHCILMTRH
jgi:hypothetical protein